LKQTKVINQPTTMERPTEERIQEMLVENQQKRKFIIEAYKVFIDSMAENKKKGIRYRKWLRVYLLNGANRVFKTEDEEYEYINKFGRGAWNEDEIRKSFNKEEQDIIVEIAHGYGAFDY
jgi:hypothetical protein